MPQLSDFARPHTHLADPDPEMTLQWMADACQKAQVDASLRLFAEKLIRDVFPHDYLSEYAAVTNWVRMNIRYSRDPITIEQVKTPQVVLETETGDCMTLDTKVIVRDRRGFYRLRTLGQLRDSYEDFAALSYDFAAGNFVFRPITHWLDKGVRPTVELQLRGGTKVHATPDHKFFVWKRHKQRVETRSVEDFWLEDHLPQGCSLLCARGPLPAMLPPPTTLGGADAAWLSGAYVAEGWHEEHHVCIAQDGDRRLAIAERLDRLGVPYSFSKREKSGYVAVRKHPFKEFLKAFGHRALVKCVPEDLLSVSPVELSQFVDGYAWGDAWINPRVGEGSHRCHVACYNTISDELTAQLRFIFMRLGRPLTSRKVEHHGGLGQRGIWRLWEAVGVPHPIKKRFAPAGLYGCHVDDIVDIGPQPVCDITVDDTHNFVTADGVVAHNCDDMCVLIGAIVGTLGAKVRFVAGGFSAGSLSHVWCEAWEPNVKAWVVLDPVPGRRVGQMLGRLVETKMIMALE